MWLGAGACAGRTVAVAGQPVLDQVAERVIRFVAVAGRRGGLVVQDGQRGRVRAAERGIAGRAQGQRHGLVR